MSHPMEAALAHAWPPEAWQDVTVLLAVSGGGDSVALLRAMVALKVRGEGRLCAAHMNHQLRGEESDADEAFVADLCGRLGVPCQLGREPVDQIVADSGEGIEAAARTARYDFLRQTAGRLGARYVVTAHTADDQAETILHRVIRGTGVAGLAGMARTRLLGPDCTLIRPLLGIRRQQLRAYLEDHSQPYRSDSSNADLRRTRNRIRHLLLPQLAEQFNPAVIDALLRLGTLAGEVQDVIDGLVTNLVQRCVAREPSGAVCIRVAPLAEQPPYLVRQLLIAAWRHQDWPLQAMGLAEWRRLAAMISPCAGRLGTVSPEQTFPGNVLACAAGGLLRLERQDA